MLHIYIYDISRLRVNTTNFLLGDLRKSALLATMAMLMPCQTKSVRSLCTYSLGEVSGSACDDVKIAAYPGCDAVSFSRQFKH